MYFVARSSALGSHHCALPQQITMNLTSTIYEISLQQLAITERTGTSSRT